MKHLAAYILLALGGKATPTAEEVSAVITAAGGEVDEEKLNTLIAELEGKSVDELIAAGKESLKSVSLGGGGGGGGAAGNFLAVVDIILVHNHYITLFSTSRWWSCPCGSCSPREAQGRRSRCP